MTRTLALLESPAQILNLLEWTHGDGTADPREVTAAVILPRAAAAREQLRAMAALARAEGLTVSLYSPRDGMRELARCGAVLSARVCRAATLVLGDPFSQLAQSLLPLSRARRVVVVDDGTATIEFVARLAGRRPLVRWHSTHRPPGRALRATRWLAAREPEVFTSLEVTAPEGVRLTVNTYAWAKARFGPPEVIDTVDLLGTSLVETGVVSREAYFEGVKRLVTGHGVTRYLAHRRESPDKLAALVASTGVEVVHPELPLELHARTGPTARTVISFPSTMVHTLPLMLAGTGVDVVIQEIGPEWLTADASEHAAGFLAEVTGSARVRHGLATVPPTPATGEPK
ncbi:hypothetical protein [Phytomonospora endophytica]|uniref:Uncharacterized protein n=1 Tax=Phytomonospora endophytica TaxID=714109 RepID=A0A841FIH8_9ACTN|nr:hypothetical protein [Phytomonospora endophytica]MBB6035674.1 hypothetical protein [Phytomonospora endophytica]GIG69649.1 hypothetical protein Pen01_59440 [Phytomonospora endophytica]